MKLYNKNFLLKGLALLMAGVFFMYILPHPKAIVTNFNLIWGIIITAGCVMVLRSFLDPEERSEKDA